MTEDDEYQSILLARQFLLHSNPEGTVNESWFKEWLAPSMRHVIELKRRKMILTEIVTEKKKAAKHRGKDNTLPGVLLQGEKNNSAEALLKKVTSELERYENGMKYHLFELGPIVEGSLRIQTGLHAEVAFYGQLVKFALEVAEYLRSKNDTIAIQFISRLKNCEGGCLDTAHIFKHHESGELYKQHRKTALEFIKKSFEKKFHSDIFLDWFETKESSFTNLLERKVRHDKKPDKIFGIPLGSQQEISSLSLNFWPQLKSKS